MITNFELYKASEKEHEEYIELLKSPKEIGVTSGMNEIDVMSGRIREGAIWILGGYSGTGKSFFVLNMLNGILKEIEVHRGDSKYVPPKVAVFSSEISTTDYIMRHMMVSGQMYQKLIETTRDPILIQRLESIMGEYYTERYADIETLRIEGDVYEMEYIEEVVRERDIDLFIIDHIQDIHIKDGDSVIYNEKDALPLISGRLHHLVKSTKKACLVVSQINNYAVNTDTSREKLSPFSFGKQLYQSADTAIVLNRRKFNSKLANVLECDIIKARHGEFGRVAFKIGDGFSLEGITLNEANLILEQFQNEDF